jgi:hypothetical protein
VKAANEERAVSDNDPAETIQLSVWQDPQGEVVLEHGSRECHVFFGCWSEAGVAAEFVAQVTFDWAWASRVVRTEFVPYRFEPNGETYLLRVARSGWLAELTGQRLSNYPKWRDWDKRTYHHFVVVGHDSYVDVIAEKFSVQKLGRREAGKLSRLIDNA